MINPREMRAISKNNDVTHQNSEQNTNQTAPTPLLSLREWVYSNDGKHIKELLESIFMEFHLMKKIKNNEKKNESIQILDKF